MLCTTAFNTSNTIYSTLLARRQLTVDVLYTVKGLFTAYNLN